MKNSYNLTYSIYDRTIFLTKEKKYQTKKIVHNQIFNRYLTLQKKFLFLNLILTSYQQKKLHHSIYSVIE